MPQMRMVDRLYVELPFAKPGTWQAFAGTAVIAAVATTLRVVIEPWVNGVQFITLFPAVVAASLCMGAAAGIFCVALCGLGAWYFVLPPVGTVKGLSLEDGLALGLFLAVGLLIALLVGAMRLAIARHRHLSKQLEALVSERTAELLRTQNDLAHWQKMEAVGQLSGGVAHDFNNMLAVITGNLDLVKRRLATGRTDISRYIDSALEGAEKAAALTKRLLAFARRQPLVPKRTDVNRLVQSLAELMRSSLGEGIEIECVLGAGAWQTRVDAAQLESGLLNLAVNARDAMNGSGKLTIETANAFLDQDYASKHSEVDAGQYVLIALTDTGCGMTPEIAQKAFEPFFTTKEVGQGTGLGLSQVFGFVKQSKGHVALYTEPGKGTTVRIYLPRNHEGANIRSSPGTASGTGSEMPLAQASEVILVVEDEDQVRATTVETLQELGYQVLSAPSGIDALKIIRSEERISLLFSDVIMPQMNGRELAAEAQRLRPGLPVLFTTGYTRNAIVHNGQVDDGVALISKPFDMGAIARMLRTVLDADV